MREKGLSNVTPLIVRQGRVHLADDKENQAAAIGKAVSLFVNSHDDISFAGLYSSAPAMGLLY